MTPIIFTTIFVVFLIILFLAWYFTQRAKERERLLLIEKAIDKDLDLSSIPLLQDPEKSKFNFPWLKVGIVVTCLSLGFLIGLILYENGFHWAPPPLIMFLFGGIGMIIAQFIAKHKTNDKT